MTDSPLIFSIIVPTRDRPAQLAQCLDALARLSFPRDQFEIIVVDDGSQTSPGETVAAFQRKIKLVLVTQSPAGPAAARNTGALRAHGDFLAFTDDDCTPSADWLTTLAARLNGAPRCAVGGQTINSLPQNLFSTASQLLIRYLYAHYNRDSRCARFLATNNLAVPRAPFLAVGGFDASFPLAAAEDRDFCDRWLLAGNVLVYEPRAVVRHAHALTFEKFFRQHREYGRGAVYFHRARRARGQGRVRFEPPGFYWRLITFPIAVRERFAPTLCLLLTLTQIATLLGFWGETVSQSRRHAPRQGAGN